MDGDMMDEGYALLADMEGPESAAAEAAYARRRRASGGMVTRDHAFERAKAYLRKHDSDYLVSARDTRPNPSQRLWIVGLQDPRALAGEAIGGGSVLVVPSDAPVYELNYLPGAHPELIGVQSAAEEAGLPTDWAEVISDYLDESYWWTLAEWLDAERAEHRVYPGPDDVFAAFNLTPYDDTRVVILGQDPYHRPGQASGLSFSVPLGVPKPRSLVNIHQVLRTDLGIAPLDHGNLESWARQGVLLLNTALTVQEGNPGSHAHRWTTFTDALIRAISNREQQVVFVLWGQHALGKKHLIGSTLHKVVASAHPTSRQNATDPFAGSTPFSAINRFLEEAGSGSIEWASSGSHT